MDHDDDDLPGVANRGFLDYPVQNHASSLTCGLGRHL
jgi:hypothetical protein